MKTGRRSKDAGVADNFNSDKIGVLSKKDLARASRKARAVAVQDKLGAQAEAKAEEKKGKPKRKPRAAQEKFEDLASANQMLEDMRFAYRNAANDDGLKGKRRLVDLMGSDPEFKFMIKELMKIEASLIATRIRKEGPEVQDNRMVFVILKGLAEEAVIMDKAGQTFEQKQIGILLNPDGTEAAH